MSLYSATSAPLNEGVGKVYLFPHNEKFLAIIIDQNRILKVDLLSQPELSFIKSESHYFDIGSSFNLLPKLSDELVDEAALKEFMGWTANSKVYHFQENTRGVEIQFQTSSVSDYAVSHSIPAVHKHHIIEIMLSISQLDGVNAVVYANQLYISVVDKTKLVLCNIFNTKTDEEVMYYLLLIFQELGLSQEETKVIFYGNFPENPSNSNQYLSSYFRNFELRQFRDIEEQYQGITQLALAYHENH